MLIQGSRLEDATNETKQTGKSNGASSAKNVTGEHCNDRPENTTEDISRGHLSLDCGIRVVEDGQEGLIGQNAAENALVVSKEHERHPAGYGDSHCEGFALCLC